ncbi:hypothetical protein FBU30_010912 [Linnemannia zychae]|nr:hypothetical protein FBU30_010912 [Linnemannia zychae]
MKTLRIDESMLFKVTNILSVIAVLGAVMAQDPALTEGHEKLAEGFHILHTEAVQNGALTWYGDSSVNSTSEALLERRSASLSKRCGENHVTCYGSHRGHFCDTLINILAKNKESRIPDSPRAVCYRVEKFGQQCCTSWSAPIYGYYGYLINAARSIFSQCTDGSGTSGLSRDTLIGQNCVTQCLSSRLDGFK